MLDMAFFSRAIVYFCLNCPVQSSVLSCIAGQHGLSCYCIAYINNIYMQFSSDITTQISRFDLSLIPRSYKIQFGDVKVTQCVYSKHNQIIFCLEWSVPGSCDVCALPAVLWILRQLWCHPYLPAMDHLPQLHQIWVWRHSTGYI